MADCSHGLAGAGCQDLSFLLCEMGYQQSGRQRGPRLQCPALSTRLRGQEGLGGHSPQAWDPRAGRSFWSITRPLSPPPPCIPTAGRGV